MFHFFISLALAGLFVCAACTRTPPKPQPSTSKDE
jgi:hypothetical protein